jgi:DNA-binding NtrC family response regulator
MKLLIVDDDKDVLNDITNALEPSGYSCTKTTNPLEAIALYKQSRFDVVISDVRMPEMSGIELLKEIKNFDAKAAVIIITAFGDLETAIAAINSRAYAFFGKPINFAELITTLRQIEIELQEKPQSDKDYENLEQEHKKLKIAFGALSEVLSLIDNK